MKGPVYFWEYRRNPDERMVTIGQLFLGTLGAFALMVLYVLFAWIEG